MESSLDDWRHHKIQCIDLAYMIKMENFKKSGNWADLPSPTIVEHYVKGEYGRKTKKGFYDYSEK